MLPWRGRLAVWLQVVPLALQLSILGCRARTPGSSFVGCMHSTYDDTEVPPM